MNEDKRRLAREFCKKTGIYPHLEHVKREVTQLRIHLIKHFLKQGYIGDKKVSLNELSHDLRTDREKIRDALYGAVISPVAQGIVEKDTIGGLYFRVTHRSKARWYISFLQRTM